MLDKITTSDHDQTEDNEDELDLTQLLNAITNVPKDTEDHPEAKATPNTSADAQCTKITVQQVPLESHTTFPKANHRKR